MGPNIGSSIDHGLYYLDTTAMTGGHSADHHGTARSHAAAQDLTFAWRADGTPIVNLSDTVGMKMITPTSPPMQRLI
jgi:hypothetical protein